MTMTPRVAACIASALGVAAVVACSITDDPRPGIRREGPSGSSSGASSSGGLDAALPDTPIDCGAAPASTPPFTKQALLEASATCAAYHSCTFLNAAVALRKAMRDGPTADEKRAAWRTAMSEWSAMELFQFGPVASTVTDKYHGRGLRSFVHPWPDLNRCQVEGRITSRDYKSGWDVVLPSARGLHAIEYVAFHQGEDTACLPESETGKAWAALTPDARGKAKAEYGSAVADNVAAVALEIRNVWQDDGEGFRRKLLAHEGYGSDQEALTVVAWSLVYAERELKDLKLASLAGFSATPPVPETPYARVEIENIRRNLRAFRSLFQGCGTNGGGIGFDDWLVAAGHAQLANDIVAAHATALAAADAFPPFAQATQAQFVDLYNAVKALTNLLKASFFGSASPLNLRLPAGVASDTD